MSQPGTDGPHRDKDGEISRKPSPWTRTALRTKREAGKSYYGISEGARVRWSAIRRASDPRRALRIGTVVGFTRHRNILVLWDGNKRTKPVPLGFIEVVAG